MKRNLGSPRREEEGQREGEDDEEEGEREGEEGAEEGQREGEDGAEEGQREGEDSIEEGHGHKSRSQFHCLPIKKKLQVQIGTLVV